MASNEGVLVENAVSKLDYLQFTTIGISTFLDEYFKLMQFHLKPSACIIYTLITADLDEICMTYILDI